LAAQYSVIGARLEGINFIETVDLAARSAEQPGVRRHGRFVFEGQGYGTDRGFDDRRSTR